MRNISCIPIVFWNLPALDQVGEPLVLRRRLSRVVQAPAHFAHCQVIGCRKVPVTTHDAIVGLPPEVGEVLPVVAVQVLDVVSQVLGSGKVFDVDVRVRRGHLVVSAAEKKSSLPILVVTSCFWDLTVNGSTTNNNENNILLTYSPRTIGTTFHVNARQNFSLMYWSHKEFSNAK